MNKWDKAKKGAIRKKEGKRENVVVMMTTKKDGKEVEKVHPEPIP